MKEVFKYTFTTIANWQKFLLVIVIMSFLTFIQAFPVISIASFIFEKLLYLSIGAFLIYLVKNSKTIDSYYENLKTNAFSTFLFHFLPTASGILIGMILISMFWFMFFILILQATNSMFILANPHELFISISHTSTLAKILLAIYVIYLSLFSYIFLGKFGEALEKESFRSAFLSIVSSLVDFKFWLRTFNLKYFIIYFVWSLIIVALYTAVAFTYLFVIFPIIISGPNFTLAVIPVLVGITTILSYFTFFSAYFSYKTTI